MRQHWGLLKRHSKRRFGTFYIMNNYAKHHNKTSKNVLEYIMYQTGNIIRLLITLNQEEHVEKELEG